MKSPWLGTAHSGLTWANVTGSGVAAEWPSVLQICLAEAAGKVAVQMTQQPTHMRYSQVVKGQVALATKVSSCSLCTEVSGGSAVCDAPPQALFTAVQRSEVCTWAACPWLPFFPWKEMGTPAEKFTFPVFRCLPEDEP